MYKLFYVLCVLSLLLPLTSSEKKGTVIGVEDSFPGWPQSISGYSLTEIALSEKETQWFASFPGKASRFQTMQGDVFIRWITKPTRRLHPVKDCLKASGYFVVAAPLKKDVDGSLWGCVEAEKQGVRYRVCEQIKDSNGNYFSDVSSWFWQSVLGKSQGPWWSVASMEKI